MPADIAPSFYDRWAGDHAAIFAEGTEFVQARESVWPSLIQRKVRVGFATARMLLDVLQDRGIVGPLKPDGKRDVLKPPGGQP